MVIVDLYMHLAKRIESSMNDKQRPSQWVLNKLIHALGVILKSSIHFALWIFN